MGVQVVVLSDLEQDHGDIYAQCTEIVGREKSISSRPRSDL